MSSIYIISNAGKLSKDAEKIVFTQPDGTSTILFPFKTETLFVVGKISVSGDALRMFAKYKIPVIFLSANGRFNAKLVYGDSKNVFLRQKQYALLSSPEKSCAIVQSIVVGKIKNQISFMQRIKRKKDDPDCGKKIERAVSEMKESIDKCMECTAIDTLRGLEGYASKKYFEVFNLNITCPWASFPRRSKNPPETNVNAVLSFLYTLLLYRVESAVESTGLDVMAGNLHTCDYGRASLVFDLMEEFRTPIADTVCCALFNLSILAEDDFRNVDFNASDEDFPLEEENESSDKDGFSSPKKGVLLTECGMKKVIKAFEEKMGTLVLYENEKLSYQKIIVRQAQAYKRMVAGEASEYRSFYYK